MSDYRITVDAGAANREIDRTGRNIQRVTTYFGDGTRRVEEYGDELDRTGRKSEKATKQMDRTGRASQAFGSVLKQLLVTLVSVQTILGAIGVYAQFEQSMADLRAITGATNEQMIFLEGSARRMGATSRFSAGEAAQAFKLVASAKPDLLESSSALAGVTEQVLLLAAASGEDLTRAADIVGESLNQFAVGASEANRFVNVLAAGSKFGASAVAATGDALKNVGVVAKSAGLSFEQTVASLQVLAASGIKSAEAGTALKTVLARLESQSDERFKPSVVGLQKAFENVAAQGWSTAEIFQFFGRYGATAAIAISKNTEALDEMTTKLTGTDVAGEQAAIQMDTLLGDWKNMKSALEELMIAMVGAFGQDMRNQIQGTTSVIKTLSERSLDLGVFWINVKNIMQQIFWWLGRKGVQIWIGVNEIITQSVRGISRAIQGMFNLLVKAGDGALSMMRKAGLGGTTMAKNLQLGVDSVRAIGDTVEKVGGVVSGHFEKLSLRALELEEAMKSTAEFMQSENAEAAAELALRSQALREAIHGVKVAVEDTSGALEELSETDAGQVVDGITASMKDYKKQLEGVIVSLLVQNEQFGKSKATVEAYIKIAELQGKTTSELGQEILGLADMIATLTKELEKKNDALAGDEAVRAEITRYRELTETYGLTEKALREYNLQKTLSGTSNVYLMLALVNASEAYEKHRESVDRAAAATQRMNEIQQELSATFGEFLFDWIERGEDAIEEFGEYIKDQLIQSVADAVAQMIVSGILNITVNGGGQGQQQGGVQGIMGNFLERKPRGERGTGVAGSGYSGAQVGQAGLSGLGIGLAASEAYGYGTTESQLTGTLGGAATGAAYGGWIGAIVGAIAGGLTSGLFTGTDWASIGYQLAIEISDGVVTGYEQYNVSQRDEAFFGGTERRSTVADVHDLRLQDTVTAGLNDTRDLVLRQASILGVETAQALIDSYDRVFSVDLTGAQSQDEITARLDAAFRESQNSMVNFVLPQVGAFQRVGEDLARTFRRLSDAADTVDTQFIGMGFDPDSFINEDSIAQTLTAMEDWRERLFQGYIEPLLSPEFPDVQSILDEPDMKEIADKIEELYGDAVEFTDIEATLIEMAIIDFKDRMATAVGGAEDLRDIFARYTLAFENSNDFLDRSVVQAVSDAEAIAEQALAAAGTTRETFVADLDAAMNSNLLTPEELALLYAAGAALSDLMVAEQTLADHRGEAYRVESLTVDQLALVVEETERLNVVMSELQTGITLTEQNIIDLSAVFGSAAGFSQEYTGFMRTMLGETQFAALQFEAAQGTIQSFGLSLEEVAAGGRQAVVDLVNAAIAAGDFERAAVLMRELGVAVDTYLNGIGQSADDTADQADDLTDSFVGNGRSIADLVVESQRLGPALTLTDSAAQALANTLGSVEAAIDRVNFVHQNFLTSSQRLEVELDAASNAITAAGFTVEEFAEGGRQHFLNLLTSAQALGDDALVATLYDIAPAVLTVIRANTERASSEEDLADTVDAVTQATRDYTLELDALDEKITQSIARIRSVANSALGGRGSAHNLTSINASIADAEGRIGVGSIGSQIRNLENLSGLITSQFEVQVAQIQELQRLEDEAHRAEIERKKALYEESLRRYEEELRIVQQLHAIAQSTRAFVEGLNVGNLSTLTPLAQLEEAQARLAELIALGSSGDPDAANAAQGQASTVLQLAQSIFGGTLPYVDIFNSVTSQLEAMATSLEAIQEPEKPVEQIFPEIETNTRLTAERASQISYLESVAIARQEEIRQELEDLRELAEEEAEQQKEREIENNEALKSADQSLADLKEVAEGTKDRTGDVVDAVDALLFELQGQSESRVAYQEEMSEGLARLPEAIALTVQSAFDSGAQGIISAIGGMHSELVAIRSTLERRNEIAEDQVEATAAQTAAIEETNDLLEDQGNQDDPEVRE